MIDHGMKTMAARLYYLITSAVQWGFIFAAPFGYLIENRLLFFTNHDHTLTVIMFILGAIFGLLMEGMGKHHLSLAQRLRRGSLRAQGRCEVCTYNLRGNPDAGCPECGWNRVEKETKRATDKEMK